MIRRAFFLRLSFMWQGFPGGALSPKQGFPGVFKIFHQGGLECPRLCEFMYSMCGLTEGTVTAKVLSSRKRRKKTG
jgi:hypothetical protein